MSSTPPPPPAPGVPVQEEEELLKEPNPFATGPSVPRPVYPHGFYPQGPGPQYPIHYPCPPVQYPYLPAPKECKQCREREGKLKQLGDLLGEREKVRGASLRDMGPFPLPEPGFQGFKEGERDSLLDLEGEDLPQFKIMSGLGIFPKHLISTAQSKRTERIWGELEGEVLRRANKLDSAEAFISLMQFIVQEIMRASEQLESELIEALIYDRSQISRRSYRPHTGVKIKIKILILSSHTPVAVKIPLPHSKSNDIARQDSIKSPKHHPAGVYHPRFTYYS
eukprot:sb/3467915/